MPYLPWFLESIGGIVNWLAAYYLIKLCGARVLQLLLRDCILINGAYCNRRGDLPCIGLVECLDLDRWSRLSMMTLRSSMCSSHFMHLAVPIVESIISLS